MNSQAGGVNAAAIHKNCFVFNSIPGLYFGSTGDGQYLINSRVGIGTNNPQVPLDVSGFGDLTLNRWYFDAGLLLPASGTGSFSIRAADGIVGSVIAATSDERIKNIQGRSDSAGDLDKLLGIEITDYHLKDVVEKGNQPQKKVIAQQVEKVFPQAVNQMTDVVPDIYKKAQIMDGWVALATDLKPGERVRLITEKGHRAVHEVLEVADGKFRTDLVTDAGQVFVYGREVDDFRTVDYDAISMLNVSATQELARKLEVSDAKFTKLSAENAAMRAENAAMRAELTKLNSANEALTKKLAVVDALTEKLARLEQVIGRDNGAQRISTVIDLKASN